MQPVTIVFGAFDRHNFGDLLFARVAEVVLRPRRLVYAGLANADLRPFGGTRVQALPDVLARQRRQGIELVHAGGELLTCSAWEAAVMLLPARQATPLASRLDHDLATRTAWAHGRLRRPDLAPYVAAPGAPAGALRLLHVAVGGVGLAGCEAAMQREVLDKLRRAEAVSVRDHLTHALLARAGIASRLMPDPAVLTARLLDRRIRRHAHGSALSALRQRFPRGYLAVQFSADFGDDATLDALARALDQSAREAGCGIALFRAGAAYWHDDIDCYRRLTARMRVPAAILPSLNLWNICALITGARCYLGSSLHGRIVATAYALPRVNLCLPGQEGKPSKQAAYAATWDLPAMPGVLPVHAVPEGVMQAMGTDPQARLQLADLLAERCLAEYVSLCRRRESVRQHR
ncbi:polysaccharide pyruvyl transferase family protein [Noviherbaspirillum sp. L7-7A]|uniref:polysaccharide pyruvyl transferase family protein n=1 Tax=Noviherbaspirillum sp. L7-7A TaxID=2850560 RepID=UPI002013B4FC|nr:polysaccharide pyruvyl transferase family protein [Noviherbaspirillum sp. L7-7A]